MKYLVIGENDDGDMCRVVKQAPYIENAGYKALVDDDNPMTTLKEIYRLAEDDAGRVVCLADDETLRYIEKET